MLASLRADIARLDESGNVSMRSFARGLLAQGFQAILVYRFFNWLNKKGISGHPFRFLCERFIEITTGISIPAACTIGKGLRIHHFGGIILHPTVIMGNNCTLYHEVTIGDKDGKGKAAIIGDNVLIGAGTKIIGEILIGEGVVIGANSVVNRDVPANCVVAGNPAKIIRPSVHANDA